MTYSVCPGGRAPAAGLGSGPAGGRGGGGGEAGGAAHQCPAAAGGQDDGQAGIPAQGREPVGTGHHCQPLGLALLSSLCTRCARLCSQQLEDPCSLVCFLFATVGHLDGVCFLMGSVSVFGGASDSPGGDFALAPVAAAQGGRSRLLSCVLGPCLGTNSNLGRVLATAGERRRLWFWALTTQTSEPRPLVGSSLLSSPFPCHSRTSVTPALRELAEASRPLLLPLLYQGPRRSERCKAGRLLGSR